MQKSDRYSFEFCPDTTEQLKELQEEMKQYGHRVHEDNAAGICERIGIRCRVLKNNNYHHHIFEDGTSG